MRVRTEAKRSEIVAVAADLFIELGYDRTSMSLVSQTLGGSKATLYGYFKSKEDLLLAVVEAEVERGIEEVLGGAPTDDVRAQIRTIGLRFLEIRTSERTPRFFRIMASLPEESGIGRTFYKEGLVPGIRRLSALLEALIARGVLRPAHPWTMALHLKGLLDRDFLERAVLAHERIPHEELERAADEAADTFLAAYGA